MNFKSLPYDHGHLSKGLQLEFPEMQTFDAVSELFKMMSDGKRMQIFWFLCHCEECVINISALFEISSSSASHHLKLLKTAGLITSRREGKEVYYTASKSNRAKALHEMVEQVMELECPDETEANKDFTYDSTVQTVNEVHKFLIDNLANRYTIDDLALNFHINKTTLKTTFKMLFGQSIGAHIKEHRINYAKKLLCQSNKSIADIAAEVGYENQSKFTAVFRSIVGVLPKDYRKEQMKRR